LSGTTVKKLAWFIVGPIGAWAQSGSKPEQQPLWQTCESKVDAHTILHYGGKPVLASPEDVALQQISGLVDQLQSRLAALKDAEQAANNPFSSEATVSSPS
jgi:hypothetical protein